MKSKFSDHTCVFLYDFYYFKPFIKETRRKNLNKEKKIKKEVKRKKKIHAWLPSDIHCAWI
jgi:hypothetical protein